MQNESGVNTLHAYNSYYIASLTAHKNKKKGPLEYMYLGLTSGRKKMG